MKQKYKSRLQLFLIITGGLALLYVYGVACTSDLGQLTAGQVIIRGGIGIAYVVISAITYKYVGKEE
jgi:hypothetical protein